ncbi:MAG TPA: hypothetical protein VFQ20_12380 [Burkholderiaceae bacterium]|nr:hypothetical protein [Burkholderiaceae bacterium]
MKAAHFERRVREDLRLRRWLRLHCALIALSTLLVGWAGTHALMQAGVASMGVRYGLAFAGAYLALMALLYAWGRWLLTREEGDVPDASFDLGGSGPALEDAPAFRSGQGGDFGGAGGGGSFELPDGVGAGAGSVLEGLGGADEGVVVLVPLAVVLGIAVALGAALGIAVFGLFGVEVLLGVAVEIAFASLGAAVAVKARREGWLSFALRRTWWPAVLTAACLVGAGLALDAFVPGANALPEAVRLLRTPA